MWNLSPVAFLVCAWQGHMLVPLLTGHSLLTIYLLDRPAFNETTLFLGFAMFGTLMQAVGSVLTCARVMMKRLVDRVIATYGSQRSSRSFAFLCRVCSRATANCGQPTN